MAKLSYKKRQKLPTSSFAEPKQRKYPINDEAHARNALARVSQFGSEGEKATIRRKVHKKFPGISVSGAAGAKRSAGKKTITKG